MESPARRFYSPKRSLRLEIKVLFRTFRIRSFFRSFVGTVFVAKVLIINGQQHIEREKVDRAVVKPFF